MSQTPTANHPTGTPPTGNRPIVALLLTSKMRAQMLTPEAEAKLAETCTLRTIDADSLTESMLADLLQGARAALTGWGTPPITQALLNANPALGLVAHSAGSIRKLVPLTAVASQRLRVASSAGLIADAVAEFVLCQTLCAVRKAHEHDPGMKFGLGWFELRERFRGRLLGAHTVGIVGAGHVGRAVIRLFKAFGCRVLVLDPILQAAKAAELGVHQVTLEHLLTESDIISLHAPAVPATTGMIGAAEFARMKDGALFINTSRPQLVDSQALLDTLRTGRISAILDVFDEEPLPAESPLRALPNAMLSPHAAGHSTDTYKRQGQAAACDIIRFLRSEPLHHEVLPSMLDSMA